MMLKDFFLFPSSTWCHACTACWHNHSADWDNIFIISPFYSLYQKFYFRICTLCSVNYVFILYLFQTMVIHTSIRLLNILGQPVSLTFITRSGCSAFQFCKCTMSFPLFCIKKTKCSEFCLPASRDCCQCVMSQDVFDWWTWTCSIIMPSSVICVIQSGIQLTGYSTHLCSTSDGTK